MKLVNRKEIANLEQKFPLFFQQNYEEYELTKGWKIILFCDDGVVMPLKIRTTRFIKQAGYVYPPLRAGELLTSEEEKKFLEKMILFCRTNSICDFIAPPLHFSVFHALPEKSYFTNIGIIKLDLLIEKEDLIMSFNHSCRKKIRKAVNEGLTVEFDNRFFAAFYELYKNLHKEQGIYYDTLEDLQNLVTCLGEENCIIGFVKKDTTILGTLLVVFSGEEAYAYCAGSVKESNYHGINYLLQYEMMKWLQSRGVKKMCMGGFRQGDIRGSKYEGIQNFKLSFRPEIEKGYHFYTKITWRYTVYNILLRYYLKLRGLQQNTTGLNWRYN
jgi:hypothetical protein